jgi:hypothetical protein
LKRENEERREKNQSDSFIFYPMAPQDNKVLEDNNRFEIIKYKSTQPQIIYRRGMLSGIWHVKLNYSIFR